MSQNLIQNAFEPDLKFNLNDMNFRLAFTMEGVLDLERKNDPRYVKQYVRYFGSNTDGARNYRLVPFHECTEADLAQFYPVQSIYKKQFDDIANNPKRGASCIDFEKEDLNLWSSESLATEFQKIDIILAPCNVVNVKALGSTTADISPECIPDFEQ